MQGNRTQYRLLNGTGSAITGCNTSCHCHFTPLSFMCTGGVSDSAILVPVFHKNMGSGANLFSSNLHSATT